MKTGLHITTTASYLTVILLFVKLSVTTINVNLAQYEYLANHMTTDECYRLIASLHMTTYNLRKNFDEAVNDIPDDVSCLSLLLEWNSTPGEGKGQTHKIISHRLLQVGRKDLAQWLEKSVFKELTDELKRNDTLTDEAENKVNDNLILPTFDSPTELQDKESAKKLSALILIITIILITIVGVFSTAFCINCLKNHKKQAESKIISLHMFKTNEEETSAYSQTDEDSFQTYETEDDYYDESMVHKPLIDRYTCDQNIYL